MGRTCSSHVLSMFCACSFHGNSINNLLSYYGLVDAKISDSEKDLLIGLETVVDAITPTTITRQSHLPQFADQGNLQIKVVRYS